jgi:hypothetical protein
LIIAGFLLGLHFSSGDGVAVFLRIFGLSPNYTALQPEDLRILLINFFFSMNASGMPDDVVLKAETCSKTLLEITNVFN